MLMRSDFDWKGGDVTHWVYEVDENIPFESQLDNLTEDLIQVVYPKDMTVDVGWYPDMSPEGCFRVLLVVAQQWEEPRLALECRTVEDLKRMIAVAIDVASS
jgi:hypothetical protein